MKNGQSTIENVRQFGLTVGSLVSRVEELEEALRIATAQAFEDAAKIAELHDDTGESGYSTAHDIAKNLRGRAISLLKD